MLDVIWQKINKDGLYISILLHLFMFGGLLINSQVWHEATYVLVIFILMCFVIHICTPKWLVFKPSTLDITQRRFNQRVRDIMFVILVALMLHAGWIYTAIWYFIGRVIIRARCIHWQDGYDN